MPDNDTSLDAFEDYLRQARLVRAWKGIEGGGGHQLKYRVEFLGGVFAIAKLTDAGDGARQIRAEAAAWRIARIIGGQHLLSATVLRTLSLPEHGEVEASVQVYWPRCEFIPPIESFDPADILLAAVFDHIVLMEDRSGNNYLGTGPPDRPPEDGRWNLKLIDHGNSLRPGGSCSSAFTVLKTGSPLADDLVKKLGGLTNGKTVAELGELVGEDVARGVSSRAADLRKTRLLP